jgi:hypothetical protein
LITSLLPAPAVKSVMVSRPKPDLKTNVSLSAPPVRVSLPDPPTILSMPALPLIVSLPAPPSILSYEPQPGNVSLPLVPFHQAFCEMVSRFQTVPLANRNSSMPQFWVADQYWSSMVSW